MKLSILSSFFFWFAIQHVGAQHKNNSALLVENSIQEIHTYSFKIYKGKISADSSLKVKRRFNQKGSPTYTKLFNNQEQAYLTYEYLYDDDDTTNIGRNVFSNPNYRLRYTTENILDKNGRLIKSKDIRPGSKSTAGSRRKYNKIGQLVAVDYFRNGKKQGTHKYSYTPNGEIKSSKLVLSTTPSSMNQYLIHDEYMDTYVRMADGYGELTFTESKNAAGMTTEFIFEAPEEIELLGADGLIKLSTGDKLKIDIEYHRNGLQKQKTQYLNGMLQAFVTFQYHTR